MPSEEDLPGARSSFDGSIGEREKCLKKEKEKVKSTNCRILKFKEEVC